MPKHTDDRSARLVDQRGTADRALMTLAAHGLAPSPENFRLWYHHLRGDNPELSRAIKHLTEGAEPISDERCAELHERFYGSAREERTALQGCRRLYELAQSLLEQAGNAGRDTERFGTALHEAQAALAPAAGGGGAGAAQIGPVLMGIMAETSSMLSHIMRLEQSLRASSDQVAHLQNDLKAAWREARTDGLTGVANRKQFDLAVRAAAAHAAEQGTPVCLLLADIDHFKQFNDRHGHQMGDSVLRLVATVLRQNVKGQDLVARYGGEEFAVVLPATRLRDAFSLANRIRETVASKQVSLKGQGTSLGRVTLSVGVSDYLPGERVPAWIERADQALYDAKGSGRNRVVAHPAEPPATAGKAAAAA